MKSYVVLTTINVPTGLLGYADNFEKYEHRNEVGFIVIGDIKTPPETAEVVNRIKTRGFEAEYWDIPQQEDWLKKFPDLKAIIPYNSDNRRNIGYLLAIEKGAEFVISLDDDNYVGKGDFYAKHAIVGTTQTLKTVRSDEGWFNICSLLNTDPEWVIYPRGFPYSKRWNDNSVQEYVSQGRIVLNAGLWLEDPDVDAVTRLNWPIRAVGIKIDNPIMLEKGTWSPINTQNTAFHKDILPSYYYIPMGEQIRGFKLDRYGDIWSGFFAKKVIDHMNDSVSVGFPVSHHKRNVHSLFKDLEQELFGMVLTDRLIPVLESIELSGENYYTSYADLADKLVEAFAKTKIDQFSKSISVYFERIGKCMKIWVDVCKEISA